MNAKSFNVPNKLRFMVGPNAISDIRDRSSAICSEATPTAASTSHRVRKDRLEVFRLANRNDDRKPRMFADENQVLATSNAQDVAVPVAEPSRRRHAGRNLCPFESHEQLACASKNDHRIDSVMHITMRGTFARRIERRSAAPFRAARAGPSDRDSGA